MARDTESTAVVLPKSRETLFSVMVVIEVTSYEVVKTVVDVPR